MPHQCTECGRTFPDGSKEMLSGCPDCGGNKFQFQPAGTSSVPEDEPSTAPKGSAPMGSDEPASADIDTSGTTDTDTSGTTDTDTSGTTSVSGSETDADETSEPEPRPDPTAGTPAPSDASSPDAGTPDPIPTEEGTASTEDTAQASARSDVVSPDELDRAANDAPPASGDATDERADPTGTAESPGAGDATGSEERTGPRPDVDELRDELNDQFESIRIVSPGQYELNLMELYDRQEYIISLQEDGQYVIEMPDAWGVTDE